MPDHPEDISARKANLHFKAICILLSKALSRQENDILTPTSMRNTQFGDQKKAIEHAALQVMRFFGDADSADPDWQFGDPNSNIDEAKPFTFSAAYRATYDTEEDIAVDLASRGDFRTLEALIEERGYLRSKKARQLVVAKMRGEKPKPTTSVTQARVFGEIITIMTREFCSETEARRIWLNENEGKGDALSENTLKDQWSRAKSDRSFKLKLALTEQFVDVAREKRGLSRIPSPYPRGLEKLRQLLHWVED